MCRRTAAIVLVIAAVTASLTACMTDAARNPSPTSTGSAMASASPRSAPTHGGPAPASTAPKGRFGVGTEQLKLNRGGDRPLPTTVWYPETAAQAPLILLSHGLTGRPSDYAELATAWAHAGFVVAAPAYPHTARGVPQFTVLDVLNQPADASYVISQVVERMPDRVDPERIAAAGHSAGAITTIGLFTGNRDQRLKAGVVLAGSQILQAAFTGPAVPLLFVHGRQDPTIPYAGGRAVFDAAPWPKAFLSLTAGRHTPTGPELDVVAATTTDFWRWSLYGDRAAKDRLERDATKGDRATLIDKL